MYSSDQSICGTIFLVDVVATLLVPYNSLSAIMNDNYNPVLARVHNREESI